MSRRVPAVRSESFDGDDDTGDVAPPPSYEEVMERGLVSSIQEPPDDTRSHDDNLIDRLLSRVREQRDDLHTELGQDSASESGEDEATFATARSDLTEKEVVELDEVKLSPKTQLEHGKEAAGGHFSKDSEHREPGGNKAGRAEASRHLLDNINKRAQQRDERFRRSLSLLQERQQSNQRNFQTQVSREREKERNGPTKADPGEFVEMLPMDSRDREPEEKNTSLQEIPSIELNALETNTPPRSDSGSEMEDVVDRVEAEDLGPVELEPECQPEAERDAERARRRQQREEEWDCGSTPIPFLRELVNFIVHRLQYLKRKWPVWSTQRRLILVFSVLFVIGLVLLVSLLPASFVYVDYDKMGFAYNRVTAKNDYSRVYDYGCYLLAPQYTVVLFPATAHFLDLVDLWVFDNGGLTVGLDVHLQYFLRPEELAQLYHRYHRNYNDVIERLAKSTIKNTAPRFSLDNFRLNRSMVEGELLRELRYVLSGDCCEHSKNSRFPSFGDNKKCNVSKNCHRGTHIDVAFFQFGALKVPKKVLERYRQNIILEMDAEREKFFQEKAVQEALNSLSVQRIHNEAKEIKKAAEAESRVILSRARASRLQLVEGTYQESLKKIYKHLNMSQEEDKTSLMYLQTLKHMKDNLVAFSYNYDANTVFSP